MKRYQSTSRAFREYLRANGVPIKLERDNEQDYRRILEQHISYYKSIYHKFLPKSLEAPILEIGCGEGLFLGFLAHLKYRNYLGIDLATEKLEIAQKYHPNRVLNADAFEYLRHHKNTFRLIFANFVLEHIPKKQTLEFLKLVHGALEPKGAFIASVPNMDCPLALFARYMDFTHEVGFTLESLIWVFFEAGFKGIEVHDAAPIPDTFVSRLKYRISRRFLEFICRSIGVRPLKKNISETIFCVGYKY
jgi:SAM-dependent methyltransferase